MEMLDSFYDEKALLAKKAAKGVHFAGNGMRGDLGTFMTAIQGHNISELSQFV